MKVYKYDKYVEGLNSCINQVQKAIKGGALLTEMEMFDFYFKQVLFGSTRRRFGKKPSNIYTLAEFYAESFKNIQHYRHEGYSNSDAVVFAKELCKEAYKKGIVKKHYSIKSHDTNGILFIDLYLGSEWEHTFSVGNVRQFTQTMLALVTFFASTSLETGELKDFIEEYLINTFNDVMKSVKPTPYVYTGAAKTLKSYMRNEKATSKAVKDDCKIVKFKIG